MQRHTFRREVGTVVFPILIFKITPASYIVNPIPRPVPEKPWYLERFWLIVLAGLLPFGSVFIEMYFLFTSLWAYKVYYVFGFLLLVMVISWVVTACVTIVAAYFFLNAEDHRW